MGKIAGKQPRSLRPTAAAALALALLFLSVNLKKSDCLSTTAHFAAGCNATVVGDCLPEDEEFMMESEISRMLLVRPSKTLTPQALNPERLNCDRDAYGSCINRRGVPYKIRKCNYANRCGRHP